MLSVPISVGELFDKITILEIKREKTSDVEKLENIQTELFNLTLISKNIILDHNVLNELKLVNQSLWDVESNIRKKESEQKFDSEFIQLARSVYKLNDRRSDIKRKINIMTNSTIIEEKIYDR